MESSSASKGSPLPHTGLLRDETLVLRHLLAYSDSTDLLSSSSIPKLGNKLPGSSILDFLFVCIDIDTLDGYDRILPNQQFHIGLSILDTRQLLNFSTTFGSTDIIKSYQFHTDDSKYCRKASERFLFGQSEAINISEFKPKLESLISTRDAVLVVHGDPDIKVLRNLDINLRLLYTIDTVKAAQYPLHLSRRISLEELLTTLHIPFTSLHAAGNDAHFILKALLMIAAKDAEYLRSSSTSLSASALEQDFRAIAQAPRPPTTAEIRAHAKKDKEGAKKASKERKDRRRRARMEQQGAALPQQDLEDAVLDGI